MRAVGSLIVSVVFGLLMAAALLWQLGMGKPSHADLLGWLRPGASSEDKLARFGRNSDMAGTYTSLERLDAAALYRLRATDGLCQSPVFDCRGLSRASVSALIDGILKQRDDATTKTSLVVACISAAISFVSLFKKKS